MTISPAMQAALQAASAVRGATSPNPWVGAALVRNGAVIRTGATQPPGGAHAEAAALDGVDAGGAELYVTLEPCAPFEGKRTRPCAERIIEAGVARVVVALEDPDPNVRGRGLALLRAAGVDVTVGDGAAEAAEQLRPYLKHRQTGRPYVIAKFAASLDGKTAARSGESQWITGEAARDLGHQQRAWVDAVLAGIGTVLADDPSLTARPCGVLALRQPARVVVDSAGRTPLDAKLFDGLGPVVIATTPASDPAWRAAVAAKGGQIIICEPDEVGLNLHQLLATLGQRGMLTLWAEGGGTLLGSLFDGGHVDEVWAFLAPLIIGGGGYPAIGGDGALLMSDAWRLRSPRIEHVAPDVLVRGYVGDWEP
ncbi:MAG: bifunctional diaminohydroxyphosphoribosylaminopyrimidine deaminase/5-amino-6-(5-phosphoribosylamino)uracil reductase RibD [Dehalococcoidia bacterium]